MTGKVLMILGASSEVGVELIKRVHKKYDIIIAHYYHHDEELIEQKNVLGEKLVIMQADFLDTESVKNMVEEICRKEIIPNYIVHLPSLKIQLRKFHKTDGKKFNDEYLVMVQSIVAICQAFIPHMIKNEGGSIVFMLSACVEEVPPRYMAYYVTCKYALLGLMQALTAEYASKKVRINGISPDMMETKFLDEIPELVIQQNAAKNPIGKNIEVKDVVPTIDFLLSDEAARITGQNIRITGGMR